MVETIGRVQRGFLVIVKYIRCSIIQVEFFKNDHGSKRTFDADYADLECRG